MRTFAATLISICFLVTTGCSISGNSRSGSSLVPDVPLNGNSSTRSMLATQMNSGTATSYATAVLAANPIAYYRLSDQTSSALDSSSHHLHGLFGSAVRHDGPVITSGENAPSAMFPGSPTGSDVTTNTVTIAPNSAFAAADAQLSVEAWVRPNALNATNHYVPLVSYGREAQGQPWVVQISPQSTLTVWMKLKSSSLAFVVVKSSTVLAVSQTHHVVATYDGSVARLYIDGTLNASSPAKGLLDYTNTAPTWGLSIGGAIGGIEPTFAGAISDVAIYPTILAPTTIASHYALGKVIAPPSPAPAPSPVDSYYTALVSAGKPLSYYKLNDRDSSLTDSVAHLMGSYGANVRHATAPLTTAGDLSSAFPGSPAGSDVAANAATVPANNAFEAAADGLTIEAWVKPNDYNRTGNYLPIVCYGRGIIGSAWCLQVSPQSTLDFYMKVAGGPGGYELKAATARIDPGRTYQVVAVYDGTMIRIYLNGALCDSVRASGAINYSGISAQYGLAIGGSLGFNRPTFNGLINDVSIYAHPLTATQLLQHYVAGQIPESLAEKPVSSDAFIDSIGVVTHMRSTGTPYTDSWPQFSELLRSSGIRHIGDSLIASPAWYPAHLATLAAMGIHASLITDLSQSPAQIWAALPQFRGAIENVEGPNEPDISGDPNWIRDTRAFQRGLWSLIKGHPQTAYLPVVGPSIVYQSNSTALGDLSDAMDMGSIHDYFNGLNPGTSGWGSLSELGIYGSIDWNKNVGAIVSGTRPIAATETGYGTARTSSASVDNRTLARYVPRVYLEHFLHGITRSTIYEFYDDPVVSEFSNFGLVDVANRPKASYYAIKSLIGAVSGSTSSFPLEPLRYTLSGDLNNVHHLLIQKGAGTYALLLWVETQSYDPARKLDLAVPLQNVVFSPAVSTTAMTQSVIGDSGNMTSTSDALTGGSLSLELDDHVRILTFRTAP